MWAATNPTAAAVGNLAAARSVGPVQLQVLLGSAASARSFSEAAAAAPEDTYYQRLGVSRHASVAEIKGAFRKKAKTCHPDMLDVNALSDVEFAARTAEFQGLNEAFSVLTNEMLRGQYDQKIGTPHPVGHHFDTGVTDHKDEHMTLSDATDRGTEFVEKDTNKISQWYVGQKAMTKQQLFFFKRLEKQERAQAMHDAKVRKHARIKPLSRGRSLLWLGTPVFILGLWGYNAYAVYTSEQ